MREVRRVQGVLEPGIMRDFPSRSAAATFPEWVANHVGLEQLLGAAGFLSPEFFEVEDCVFWDRYVAEALGSQPDSLTAAFGGDPSAAERYFNVVNLGEFFLGAADDAVRQESLILGFGRVLVEFWGQALRARFPERWFRFEVSSDFPDEEGVCFTFWRSR